MKKISMSDIFENDGIISKYKEGYKKRPSQLKAAEIIEDGLINRDIDIIEGETGMGKSFAYLFPIFNNIVQSGLNKRAIIVTSGISLQEQLLLKDVPFVKEIMMNTYSHLSSDDLEFALLKGKQNFICVDKIAKLGLYQTTRDLIDSSYQDIYDFVHETKTGDLSELDFIPEQSILENISCTKKGECLGKKCPDYSGCYYTKHRNKINSSKIIITNYHMLFADNNMGGSILPKYDILVFDEAHEATNIFRDFNSLRMSYNNMFSLRNKCSEVKNISEKYGEMLNPELFSSTLKDFEIVFNDIDLLFSDLKTPTIINQESELPKSYFELAKPLNVILSNIDSVIDRTTTIMDIAGSSDVETESEFLEVSKVFQKVQDMSNTVLDMKELIEHLDIILKDENNVVWLEKINDIISINFKQVEIGEVIRREFFNREDTSVILTSATMSVGGTFDYIKDQLGLDKVNKNINEFIGESPFNLTEQQLWYLPINTVEGNKFEFSRLLPGMIEEIVTATGGGALCLFTSIKNMRDTYNELRFRIKEDILVQGDMPKTKLINKFKDNPNSILFGTKSFFTGVDVPGNALRCVIIDKFPFPQPTDPVQQKLKDRNNSFYKYSIPEMVISLKQAVGRGVRSIDDKCVIAILDGRMSTAKYKGRINRSFGYDKSGTRDIEKIREFCKDLIVDTTKIDTKEYDEDLPF